MRSTAPDTCVRKQTTNPSAIGEPGVWTCDVASNSNSNNSCSGRLVGCRASPGSCQGLVGELKFRVTCAAEAFAAVVVTYLAMLAVLTTTTGATVVKCLQSLPARPWAKARLVHS